MDSKILNSFLWRIFICLATLSFIFAIPTTIPIVNTTVTELTESQNIEQNSTNEAVIHQIKSENIQEIQVSDGITESKSNNSLINQTTTGLPSIEFDVNNSINGKSPVDQLTELSAHQINMPSLEDKFGNNVLVPDVSPTTALSNTIIAPQKSIHQNNLNNSINQENIENYMNHSNITSINSRNTSPLPVLSENLTEKANTTLFIEIPKEGVEDSHRKKRSFFRSSLHSNLDELLNMKRQRRASMRSKRNTNYEDLLASLLAAEESKYNENYDSFPDKNELNALAMNYILSTMNSGDSDNKNIDLDKLSQYYYQNLLPLIETIDTDSEGTSDEENQELPIIVQPYSQSVISVLPYTASNRYQRIRRSYYDRYRNPISVYTGLKRKRSHNKGGWGRIVGANSERSAYDDEAQEANKIYSLASLLATGTTPEENRLRYKRSVKYLLKPTIPLKNM